MKSSKSKSPSSSEAPMGKLQFCEPVRYGPGSFASEPLVLREGTGSPNGDRHPFDLEERTAQFGEEIVRFAKAIPRSPANDRLINQVVGCGTSVGANYCEANEAVSKKDFLNTISRCAKEAKETRFFLRMIAAAEPSLADKARKLYREANELLLIFSSMRRK